MKLLVKENVKSIDIYEVKKESYRIKLDANESPFDTVENIGNIISDDIFSCLNRYPDNDCVELRDVLSKYANVESSSLICGNGSDQIIKMIIDAYIDKGDIVVTHSPTFSMYKMSTKIAGGIVVEVEDDETFNIQIDKIIEEANKNKAKLIFLCTPNNPTGRIISRDNIIKVIENTSALVVVDEAYYEFYGETIVDQINNYNRLIVLRTLSKAFGLAGLRIGYGVASMEIIEELNKVKPPYNLNSISQAIGIKALRELGSINKYINTIKEERKRLMDGIQAIDNIEVIPSKGNFLLLKSFNEEGLDEAFKNSSIGIRSFKGEKLLSRYIRITVGTREENQEIIQMLKEVCL